MSPNGLRAYENSNFIVPLITPRLFFSFFMSSEGLLEIFFRCMPIQKAVSDLFRDSSSPAPAAIIKCFTALSVSPAIYSKNQTGLCWG